MFVITSVVDGRFAYQAVVMDDERAIYYTKSGIKDFDEAKEKRWIVEDSGMSTFVGVFKPYELKIKDTVNKYWRDNKWEIT